MSRIALTALALVLAIATLTLSRAVGGRQRATSGGGEAPQRPAAHGEPLMKNDHGRQGTSPLWNLISVVIGGLLVLVSSVGFAIYEKHSLRQNMYAAIAAQSAAVLEINERLNTGDKLNELAQQLKSGNSVDITFFVSNATVPNVLDEVIKDIGLLDSETTMMALAVRRMAYLYQSAMEDLKLGYDNNDSQKNALLLAHIAGLHELMMVKTKELLDQVSKSI